MDAGLRTLKYFIFLNNFILLYKVITRSVHIRCESMAGILSGILAALGGPGNILRKAGEFVGDVLQDVSKGRISSAGEFGKSLARAGAATLLGKGMNQLANHRPVMVPGGQMGRGGPLLQKPQPQRVQIHRVTPAGASETRVIRTPLPRRPPVKRKPKARTGRKPKARPGRKPKAKARPRRKAKAKPQPRSQLPETELEIIEKQAFPKRQPKKTRKKRIAKGPQRPRKTRKKRVFKTAI